MIHTNLLIRRMHDSCTASTLSYFFITARSSCTASLVTNLSATSGRASSTSVRVITSSTFSSSTWIGSSCTTYAMMSLFTKCAKAVGSFSSARKHFIACFTSGARRA